MEITGLDDDDVFSPRAYYTTPSRWNGHLVERSHKSDLQTQLCASCTRDLSQLDAKAHVYHNSEGTTGAELFVSLHFDPPRSEGRDNQNSTPSEHSNQDVDSRDRDFDR